MSLLAEKRKLELVDKYNQLGDKSMDRILEKRRKRNANKDHKRVPFVRRSGGTN
jgi:ribosomal RNA-processing protein 36